MPEYNVVFTGKDRSQPAFRSLDRNLRNAQRRSAETQRSVSRSFSSMAASVGRVTLGVGLAVTAVGLLGTGVSRLANNFAQARQEFVRSERALSVLAGSADLARREFERASEFAQQYGQSLIDTERAIVRLTQFGLDTSSDALRSWAGLAAATGVTVAQAIEAVADAQTAEFERLKELGIRVANDHGTFTLRMADGTQIVTNSTRDLTEQLQELSLIKFGALADQTDTLEGSFNKVQTRVEETRREIGEKLEPSLIDLNDELVRIIDNNEGIIDSFARMLTAGVDAAKGILEAFNDFQEENQNTASDQFIRSVRRQNPVRGGQSARNFPPIFQQLTDDQLRNIFERSNSSGLSPADAFRIIQESQLDEFRELENLSRHGSLSVEVPYRNLAGGGSGRRSGVPNVAQESYDYYEYLRQQQQGTTSTREPLSDNEILRRRAEIFGQVYAQSPRSSPIRHGAELRNNEREYLRLIDRLEKELEDGVITQFEYEISENLSRQNYNSNRDEILNRRDTNDRERIRELQESYDPILRITNERKELEAEINRIAIRGNIDQAEAQALIFRVRKEAIEEIADIESGSLDQINEEARQLERQWHRIQEVVNPTAALLREQSETMILLNSLLAANKISQEEFNEAVVKFQELYEQAFNKIQEESKSTWEKIGDDLSKELSDALASGARSFDDFFDAVNNKAQQILSGFIDRHLINPIFGAIFGGSEGLFAGLFHGGGRIPQGQVGLARSDEFFVPGPTEVIAGGEAQRRMQGNSPIINVNISAVDGESVERLLYTKKDLIVGVVREGLNKHGRIL